MASSSRAASPSVSATTAQKPSQVQVQPAFWWSGMANPSLQIMLRGDRVGECDVRITSPSVTIDSIVRPLNRNYVFLYLDISKAQPYTFNIELKQGRRVTTIPYELRRREARTMSTFDASDVVYLLMPDRYANGNPANDVVRGLREQTSSQAPNARHGGDIAGMRAALPYQQQLGVTAVWPTPLLVNDMPETSYHGYAITDYYEIDPRYGTNEEYRDYVAEAHRRGIKVIQDMVFNHCGALNFLFTDRPDSTWFNYDSHYVQTSYKISAVADPHAAVCDARNAQDGWFVESMPDLNQRNPHTLRYLIQNSIWWIEYAHIDGIRQDTYPYADRAAMAQWCKAVRDEYPGYNIVGETWLNNNVGVSYWQTGSHLSPPSNDSALPSVMDFPLMSLLCSALDEPTNEWDRGLSRIYDYLSQDAVYADPMHLLIFLDNHDTPRFAQNAQQAANVARYRQALALLLTLRGIPQIYYGDELAMAADKSKGDGELRQNFPGGFAADSINAFTHHNLTPLMTATLDYATRLLNWRKTAVAVHKGTMRHFAVKDGVYVYARQYEGHTVTVLVNGTDAPALVGTARYAEVLPAAEATDIVSGKRINLTTSIPIDARGVLILDFDQ